jgi:hypothetical protein
MAALTHSLTHSLTQGFTRSTLKSTRGSDAEDLLEPTRCLMRLAFCAVQQLSTQFIAPTLDGPARGVFVRQQR